MPEYRLNTEIPRYRLPSPGFHAPFLCLYPKPSSLFSQPPNEQPQRAQCILVCRVRLYVCTYLHTQRRGENSRGTSSKRFGPGGSDGGDALCASLQTPVWWLSNIGATGCLTKKRELRGLSRLHWDPCESEERPT